MSRLEETKGHTPGPWRLARETVEDIPFGPTSMNVLCGPHGILTSVEGLSGADRALIAMAPALLAVAEAAVAWRRAHEAAHLPIADVGERIRLGHELLDAQSVLAAALAPLTEEEGA